VRHAAATSLDAQLPDGCELSDPTIEIAAAGGSDRDARDGRYLVNFRRPLIPDVNLIGYPAEYLKRRVADLFHSTLCSDFSRRR